MINALKDNGHTEGTLVNADVVVINACTLTEGAERDIRRFMNHTRSVNKRARVILAGCHAQVYPENNYGADVLLGHKEKFHIQRFLKESGQFVEQGRNFPLEKGIVNSLPKGKTRFFFKIQDGCDKFCTYCIVPCARGKPRSRPIGEIVEIMQFLKEKGVKEVVLTGIEIASYKDPESGIGLKELLRILDENETPPRMRLSSIDPLYINEGFIDVFARSKKITKSLHIPLQSGSDAILEKMERRYSTGFIQNLVEELHKNIDDIGIGMDVIVGFPTENEERFMETYRFLENLDIYYLHIFPYSARPGTHASSMKEVVAEREKKERVRMLKKLDTMKRIKFYERFLDKEVSVIPEGKIYKGLYMRGYTSSYIPVYIPYKKSFENTIVEVRIKGFNGAVLTGAVKSKVQI